MSLLKIENLKKHFVVQKSIFDQSRQTLKALDGVNLTINEGETLGLVGESGCGKSTLGRLVLSLYEPSSGSVSFGGDEVGKLKAADKKVFHRNVQIIFQDPYTSLNPRMTVGQIIEEPLIVQKMGKGRERNARVAELLKLVGLDESALTRYPHEFSGGQRQRVGIARALSVNPRLLVADEPVSALDVSVQAQIINLLLDLQVRLGFALLFISHDLSVVRYLSHRVAVMYLGRIVELADTETLFKAPAHPYTRALLSAIPVPDPKAKPKREILKGEIPNPIDPPSGCTFHPRCPIKNERCIKVIPQLEELRDGHLVSCFKAQL